MNGYSARKINEIRNFSYFVDFSDLITIHSYFITIILSTMNIQPSYKHSITRQIIKLTPGDKYLVKANEESTKNHTQMIPFCTYGLLTSCKK